MASLRFGDEVAAGENGWGGHRSHNSRDQPPFPSVEYIERYEDRLDGQRISKRRLWGDIRKFWDVCTGHMRGGTVDAGIKR